MYPQVCDNGNNRITYFTLNNGNTYHTSTSVIYGQVSIDHPLIVLSVCLSSYLSVGLTGWQMNALSAVANAWGTTNAEGLSNPVGVAIHPITGALYVADTNNHRIVAFPAGGSAPPFGANAIAGTQPPTPPPALDC